MLRVSIFIFHYLTQGQPGKSERFCIQGCVILWSLVQNLIGLRYGGFKCLPGRWNFVLPKDDETEQGGYVVIVFRIVKFLGGFCGDAGIGQVFCVKVCNSKAVTGFIFGLNKTDFIGEFDGIIQGVNGFLKVILIN